MSLAPFDGVLLDEAREPVPGALAVLLHLQVEGRLAEAQGRASLSREAVLDRAKACRALLDRGLLPAQLKSLGLPMGEVKQPRSLASLIRHLESYLEAVAQRGFVEPAVALWEAAQRQERGGRGFWVERSPEDGPLAAELQDLDPPRLRALMALPQLGAVRFRLATSRGAGRGLFSSPEPHLVRDVLPRLEQLCAERAIEHFEIEAPPGWGENPWGEALDGLFEGPLKLDEAAMAALTRAILPTGAAVLRAAVEQARAWVDEGFAPFEVAIVHPDPAGVGPLLKELLAAEGLSLPGFPGASLMQSAEWAPLWALLEGLRDRDAVRVGAGLAAAPGATRLGRALGLLGDRLSMADQAGEGPLDEILALLPEGDRAWARERWELLRALPPKVQPLPAWADDFEKVVLRLGLLQNQGRFYPAFGLLKEAWQGGGAVAFTEALDALQSFLETGTTESERGARGGLRLLAPSQLLRDWEGARATLVMDLGEGAWPALPRPLPDLDWERMAALNAALRRQDQGSAFPPTLQALWLPRAEEGERLPRGFQAEAHAFNRALALTSERFVALSAARDGEGQRRGQGPFWQALDGAGEWKPDAARAASHLRHRWEHPPLDELAAARQASVILLEPADGPGLSAEPPSADLAPGWWREGLSEDRPISPTRLEALARCPFRVMAKQGLGLQEQDDEEQVLLRLGELAHAVMQALLAGLEGAEHWPAAFQEKHGLAFLDAAALEPLVRAAAASIELNEETPLSHPARRRLELMLEDLAPDLAATLAWDLAQPGPLAGEGVAEGTWTRQLLGVERKLAAERLDTPEGPVWVRGQVDRLERLRSAERSFLRVVDYKTSRMDRLKAYADDEGLFGPHLQLPLYQWMLEASSGEEATAHLAPLKEPGRGFVMASFAKEDEASRAKLAANVGTLLRRAREGRFPAVPGEHCSHCTLSALCGRPVDLDLEEA